jgi:hypothetical protein
MFVIFCTLTLEIRDLVKSITFVLIEVKHLKYHYLYKIITLCLIPSDLERKEEG